MEWGNTRVICGVTVEDSVPRWMKEQNVMGGWITAEYSMLPYSTLQRKPRDITKGKIDGRSQEIQRLIGRAMRSAIDLEKIGSRTIWVDCDVLQADGGTRTAAITGALVALSWRSNAVGGRQIDRKPLLHAVAAVSVGIVKGRPLLDLCYVEDAAADGGFQPGDECGRANSSNCREPARRRPSAKHSSPNCSRSAKQASASCWTRSRPRSPEVPA